MLQVLQTKAPTVEVATLFDTREGAPSSDVKNCTQIIARTAENGESLNDDAPSYLQSKTRRRRRARHLARMGNCQPVVATSTVRTDIL